MQYTLHIDGGSRGNPGPAAVGVIIQSTQHQNVTIHQGGYYLGETTNNVAEYQGLLKALTLAKDLAGTSVKIFSDSQLMVRQINGQYKVKSPNLIPLHKQALHKLNAFENWKMTHVLRHANTQADEMVNMALDQGKDVVIDHDHTPKSNARPTRAVPNLLQPLPQQAHQKNLPKNLPGNLSKNLPKNTPKNALKNAPLDHVASLYQTQKAVGPTGTASAGSQRPDLYAVGLIGSPGHACPAHYRANHHFTFGPTLPDQCCMHAVKAMLNALDLHELKADARTICTHCQVPMSIKSI